MSTTYIVNIANANIEVGADTGSECTLDSDQGDDSDESGFEHYETVVCEVE